MEQSMEEKLNNLRIAAGFDANRTIPGLFQHMGYRQRVAQEILKCHDEAQIKQLEDLLEATNEIIKKILGL